MECHLAIIKGFLDGIEFAEEDVVIWFDLEANRHLGRFFGK